jgi:hypothetical protein
MILRGLGCHRRGGLSELPRPLFGRERLQVMLTSFQKLLCKSSFYAY